MSERYPDDATLLALEEDAATGVAYIPTGRSPYYLEFRRLVQRLLLAAQRANDLRVYADGDLSIGVRPGRCRIGATAIDFAGDSAIGVTNNAATCVWLDAAGAVQTDTAGWPADPADHLPLAIITADAGQITQIDDRRGSTFLARPSLAAMGVAVTVDQLNQALAGISQNVTAAALEALTAGDSTQADNYHQHQQRSTNEDAVSAFSLVNASPGGAANVALDFYLPARLPHVTRLSPDPATGYLRQGYGDATFSLLGAVDVQYRHAGELTASAAGRLIGIVPVDGAVADIVLSVGRNIESTLSTDAIAATVKVNGQAVTASDPAIDAAAGAGMRSTAQGDGTAAGIVDTGIEQVSKGDVLTVDLSRIAAGSVSVEGADVVVMVIVRAARPE